MFKLLTFRAHFGTKTHEKYIFLLVGEAQDPRSSKWNCSPWGSRTSWGTLWTRTATHWKVSENIFKLFIVMVKGITRVWFSQKCLGA